MRITLEDYDPAWAHSFNRVRQRLTRALNHLALGVEHVGSTSVPGLCAKPVIDVLVIVTDSADEAAYAGPLKEEGFRFRLREPEWYEHRLFKLDEPNSNVHVFSAGCPEIAKMLLFRNYLRRDSRARGTYAAAKQELANQEWTSVQDYADAKTDVVNRLVETALAQEDPEEHDS